MDENLSLNELAARYEKQYTAARNKKLSALGEEERKFIQGYRTSAYSERLGACLESASEHPGTSLSALIRREFSWMFAGLAPYMPAEARDSTLWALDHVTEWAYSVDWNSRSFRTSVPAAYYDRVVFLLKNSCQNISPFPLPDILLRRLPADAQAFWDKMQTHGWGSGYRSWQIAYALDTGDEAAVDAVRTVLTGDATVGTITRELILGVLMSHRAEFYGLLCDLLRGAGLQEGLRQAICESADLGTTEGFFAVFRTVRDENLIRFSSVKRACAVWLGFAEPDSRALERIGQKTIRLMDECLFDPAARETYLASEDAMELFIALWSLGVYELNDMFTAIDDLIRTGSEHRHLIGGLMARNMQRPPVAAALAVRGLNAAGAQPRIAAVWTSPLLSMLISFRQEVEQKTAPRDASRVVGDFHALAELLFRLTDEAPEKPRTYEVSGFVDCDSYKPEHSRSDLARCAMLAADLSGDYDLIDRACGYIRTVEPNFRNQAAAYLLSPPRTPLCRETLIRLLSDSSPDTRKEAYKALKGLKLTDDEYRTIETYYRFKAADLRGFVTEFVEKQSDEALSGTIGRLLEDKKEDVRCAGLDLLARREAVSDKKPLTERHIDRLRALASADSVTAREKALLDKLLPADASETDAPALFGEEDYYRPTEFDEKFVNECLDTLTRYFPDTGLPAAVRGSKTTSFLDKLKKAVTGQSGSCPSFDAALADLRALSQWLEAHKAEPIPDGHGGTTIAEYEMNEWALTMRLGYGIANDAERERAARWYDESGMTPERLARMIVVSSHYADDAFNRTCAKLARPLFGNGFGVSPDGSYMGYTRVILDLLRDKIPMEDRMRLSGAAALWFLRCVPDDQVLLPCDGTFGRYPVSNALSYCPVSFLYLLGCDSERFDDLRDFRGRDFACLFPMTVAVGWRSAAANDAYRKTPEGQKRTKMQPNFYGSLPASGTIWEIFNSKGVYSLPHIKEYLWAAYAGVISEEALFAYVVGIGNRMPDSMGKLSLLYLLGRNTRNLQRDRFSKYAAVWCRNMSKSFFAGRDTPAGDDLDFLAYACRVYERVVSVVLHAELTRGDTPTVYSDGVRQIRTVSGAETYAAILHALDKTTLERASYYGTLDRGRSLSHLLSVCVPDENDTADTLRRALEGKNVTKKRLIEAALYAPAWIGLTEELLELPGFESACWYFMAHMNETFDDIRKAVIARYTPLSPEQLQGGAFDVEWFRSAYETLGEKTFNMVYDACKYISDGNRHTRARKFADAALGRLNVGETEAAISDKRNKDLLMAYPLIPLSGEDDLLRRYLFIQKFRKESKQFGSQRMTSESAAADMALVNLAVSAGYADVMRLTLRMETKVIDDNRALLEDVPVDDVVLRLIIDDTGKTELTVKKDGKALKSVPSRLKKHETVVRMTEMKKTLTEQHRRARQMLENAMEDGTIFTMGELNAMREHPVVFPMLSRLVCIAGDVTGFPDGVGLTDWQGTPHIIGEDESVILAHPYHLYTMNVWQNYQHYLFDHSVVQPFKQVFRELYVPTDEEKDTDHSLRYSGNQLIPQKASAVLRTRHWVADVEAGLQKVYYKENLIAELYALADWFSPSDIEAPTLEWVAFTDRRTGNLVKLGDIPPVIFSEVMRDVDLAVSVAHAGAVDPETSHSTMRMREDLLDCLLPMVGLSNVRMDKNHVYVTGALADYSIHLGSGVVHQLGGAMIPVLPVHSQHRGKVFLPFADEDPKTAEIISKVLLFAEDKRIGDPSILSSIRRVK